MRGIARRFLLVALLCALLPGPIPVIDGAAVRLSSVLMSLEPAMAAIIGLLVLQEALRGSQWIAVACVVVAFAGATLGARHAV